AGAETLPQNFRGSLSAPTRGDLMVRLTLGRCSAFLLCAFWASSMERGRLTPHWRPWDARAVTSAGPRRVSTGAPGYRAILSPTLPGAALPFHATGGSRSRSLGRKE